MQEHYADILRDKLDAAGLAKLEALDHDEVHAFVAYAVELCQPEKVLVCDDSDEDVATIRRLAVENREERPLAIEGHTIHFDGYYDQARKKEVTKYLVPKGDSLDPKLNQIDRDEGLREIEELQRGAYRGRTMLVAGARRCGSGR